ncbi:MAG: (d)CMP kinase, partial [Anaerotignum sp.]
VAKELGIIYVDTGAMYRAVAYFCMEKNVSTLDEKSVLSLLSKMKLEILPQRDGQRILLDGQDITNKIRTQEVGRGASDVAKIRSVRQKLGDMQKEMAENATVIMDGRDIGTHVLPEAEVKIYMDAGVEERAKRRMGELESKGESPVFDVIKKEIILRDEADMNREHNPLRQASDAVCLDTTKMSIDEVVREILIITKQRIGMV